MYVVKENVERNRKSSEITELVLMLQITVIF